MIIHLNEGISADEALRLARTLKAVHLHDGKRNVLVTGSKVKELPQAAAVFAAEHFVCDSDMQLSSRSYLGGTREVAIGDLRIGGDSGNMLVITGPCSVESEAQIRQSAELCRDLGVKVLRAGAFKPRTSPYSFQGLGLEGLKLLAQMRDEYGLRIITEVRDSTQVDQVIEYADIVQIGAKSMYDHGILRACGSAGKPVLLKRGFGTTLQEFVQAAEFVLSGGNADVMLCERGIRTFETKTRFTLDLCGVSWLKEHSNLPVVLDPSHAMGYAYGVPDLARACTALGIDGLLIETHPTPRQALSDAAQQLDHEEFTALYHSLQAVAAAVGRQIL